jgi:hypothetical protein
MDPQQFSLLLIRVQKIDYLEKFLRLFKS